MKKLTIHRLLSIAAATSALACSASDNVSDPTNQAETETTTDPVVTAPEETGGDTTSPAAGGSTTATGRSESSATGGALTVGSGDAPTVDPCSPFATFEESDDGFGIYANENASVGSLTRPASGAFGGAATATSGDGANGTSGALLYSGTDFGAATPEAGPGGLRFAVDPIEDCQNVSGATGISFWAKGTVEATTEWGGIDADTIVVFAVADAADEGGSQVDYRLTLTNEWTLYEIPFTDFGADGYPAASVERIKFMIPGGSFDLGLDEIGFY